LTKAGKVRSQTPKLQGRTRVAPIPKRSLRDKYRKRFDLKRRAGQNWGVP
jgi:small subunit ribosomal protein S30e